MTMFTASLMKQSVGQASLLNKLILVSDDSIYRLQGH
jgi:hypothetical protein